MGECLQIFVAIFKHVVLPIKVPMISIWQLFIFIFDMCQTTNLKLLKKKLKKIIYKYYARIIFSIW